MKESENEKRKKNEEIEKRGKGQNKEAEREGMKSEEITKLRAKKIEMLFIEGKDVDRSVLREKKCR